MFRCGRLSDNSVGSMFRCGRLSDNSVGRNLCDKQLPKNDGKMASDQASWLPSPYLCAIGRLKKGTTPTTVLEFGGFGRERTGSDDHVNV